MNLDRSGHQIVNRDWKTEDREAPHEAVRPASAAAIHGGALPALRIVAAARQYHNHGRVSEPGEKAGSVVSVGCGGHMIWGFPCLSAYRRPLGLFDCDHAAAGQFLPDIKDIVMVAHLHRQRARSRSRSAKRRRYPESIASDFRVMEEGRAAGRVAEA